MAAWAEREPRRVPRHRRCRTWHEPPTAPTRPTRSFSTSWSATCPSRERGGSDGTRIRDLRGDRPVRGSRRMTTTGAESLYSCGFLGSSRFDPAWLSYPDFRRLLPGRFPVRVPSASPGSVLIVRGYRLGPATWAAALVRAIHDRLIHEVVERALSSSPSASVASGCAPSWAKISSATLREALPSASPSDCRQRPRPSSAWPRSSTWP
jgi:hypothetical protein